MPLGFERLNVRKQPPNKLITFVEALNGPDKAIAQDFLERIAAIVYPIMRDNGLAVTSLDEFPPNLEFWGRNFNAGECIQLVLKNPKTGQWLPFQFVQGVMVHELAHIKQMNHSRAFWAVNIRFSSELRVLRSKGYTGEGFWSAGRVLISAEYTQDRPLAESDMPHSLCGGTYRSRERRHKNRLPDDQPKKKPKLTYAERQQRRKEKKFGSGEGNKVGADEDTRIQLEKGKSKSKGAPKVAQSNRGRELRAAAALKRFETQQNEIKVLEEEGDEGAGDDTDYDEAADEEESRKTVDVGGGKFLVPVSGEEDGEAEKDEMKRELFELAEACGVGSSGDSLSKSRRNGDQRPVAGGQEKMNLSKKTGVTVVVEDESGSNEGELVGYDPRSQAPAESPGPRLRGPSTNQDGLFTSPKTIPSNRVNPLKPTEVYASHVTARKSICLACSVVNSGDAILCMVCANVLEPDKMPSAWRCSSLTCGGSAYWNAGDAGICSVCGQRKGSEGELVK